MGSIDIYQIVIIGVVGAILAILLKKENPTFSLLISLMVSVLILIILLPKLGIVLELVNKISNEINTTIPYLLIVIKVIGISYITEFGAQLCIDAGESSIASKIELAGKILIFTVSSPIIFALLNQITTLIPM